MELVDNASATRQCLAFLETLGIKNDMVEARTLEVALKDTPERVPISARHIVDLLEAAAKITRRSDIGIQFATWVSTQSMPPLAVLGDQCSSFAERFRLIQRFSRFENNAITFGIRAEDDEVSFYCNLHPALRLRAQQFAEGLIALNVRIARTMLGDFWRPSRVEFTHMAPSSLSSQREYFRSPIYYEADRHAFVLSTDDFYRRLPRGNDKLPSFFEQYLSQPSAEQTHEFVSEVEALVASQLAGGNAKIGRIASLLAMSPRTLQRRLAAEGTDFSAILNSVRMLVLREYLSQHGIQLARLAHVLGFSEPSAACHFIRARTGHSATSLLNEMMAATSD